MGEAVDAAALRRTFRVRQLPPDLPGRHEAIALLIKLEPRIGSAENMRMKPLASNPDVWEVNPFKMTTLEFEVEPEMFAKDENEWIIHAEELGFRRNIIIDTHFLDFTAFNDTDGNARTFDCIAISGLASHPFGSWARRSRNSNFMWLRDALPKDVPTIRSIIYGYDTSLLESQSNQTIDDIAMFLVARLKSIGRSSLAARPLIFLAHSLGGIILKRAIVLLANCDERERFILDTIQVAVFFGVPNRGMDMRHLRPMVAGQPNEFLVESLAPGSPYLANLEKQFNGIAELQNMRIISIFETKKSQTAIKIDGIWSRCGPFEYLVDRDSAILQQSRQSDLLPIDENHSNIVKFQEGDHKYKAMLSYFREIAPDITSQQSRSKTENHDEHHAEKASVGKVLYESCEAALHQGKRDDVSVCQEMLKSLRFIGSDARFSDIDEAYEHTFEWIFEKTDIGFRQWLQNGSGIFWIQGKPGSGKSTLMKYICSDHRTVDYLQARKIDEAKLITAQFFFHSRGNHYQKSFEGLYRSVIVQMIEHEPKLQNLLLPIYTSRGKPDRDLWPISDLEIVFRELLRQEICPLAVTLFLDALDEYDGRPENIASFIEKMANLANPSGTTIQVCFSSRPWNLFLDRFSGKPGFAIHHHTFSDIAKLVEGTLKNWPRQSQLSVTNSSDWYAHTDQLVDQIVTKAQGVFLWVNLTLKELEKASINGATSKELEDIVTSLPEELETFYEKIVDSLPDDQNMRLESYSIFEVVLRALEPLEIIELAIAVSCRSSRTVSECKDTFSEMSQNEPNLESIKRRVKHLCGELVEFVTIDGTEVVQFMHQTAKDFVGKPEFSRTVLSNADGSSLLNGYEILSRYKLASIRYRPEQTVHATRNVAQIRANFERESHLNILKMASRFSVTDLALLYARLSENSTGRSQRIFLDSCFDSDFATYFDFDHHSSALDLNIWDPTLYPINSVMAFAVVANLRLYVKEKLSEDAANMENPQIPLLRCVVESTIASRSPLRPRSWRSFAEMAQILLDYGPNQGNRLRTRQPFQMLFFDRREKPYELHRVFTTDDIKLIEIFFGDGLDPDTEIVVFNDFWTNRPRLECKAIHVASNSLISILLARGADVNALDEDGRTALDWQYGVLAYWIRLGRKNKAEIAHQRVSLLLANGACLSNASTSQEKVSLGANIVEICRILEEEGYVLDERFKNPPRLPASSKPSEDSQLPESSATSKRLTRQVRKLFGMHKKYES